MNPEKEMWDCDHQGLFVGGARSEAEAKEGTEVPGGLRALGWEQEELGWVNLG